MWKILTVALLVLWGTWGLHADELSTKLLELQNAHKAGLITDQEFQTKRSALLNNFVVPATQDSVFNGAWRMSEAIPTEARDRFAGGNASTGDVINIVNVVGDCNTTYLHIALTDRAIKVVRQTIPISYDLKSQADQHVDRTLGMGPKEEALPVTEFQVKGDTLAFKVVYRYNEAFQTVEIYSLKAQGQDQLAGVKQVYSSQLIMGEWLNKGPDTSKLVLVRKMQ